jgi:uncharacterized protein YegJ (DUF2314 family)
VLPAARLRAVGIEGTVYATAAQSSWSASADPVARLGFEGRFDADPCQPLDAYPVDLVSAPAPGEAPAVAPVPGTEAASEVGVPSPPGVEAPLAPTGTVPSPEASLPGLPEPEAAPPDVAEPAPPAAPVGPANLAEARAQAASDLAGHVHAAWDQGLPPGDRLYVKAPFDDGTGKVEYLWVQVVAWHGALLEGVLRSVPAWSRTLAVGDVVRVQQGDLFDYLWRRADGTSEGNRTEAFLR